MPTNIEDDIARLTLNRVDPSRVAEQMAANARAGLLWQTAFIVAMAIFDVTNHDPGDEDRSER